MKFSGERVLQSSTYIRDKRGLANCQQHAASLAFARHAEKGRPACSCGLWKSRGRGRIEEEAAR